MNLAATHYNCTSPMDYISHHTLHSHIPIHHHTYHTAVTNHSFALIASPHLHLIHPLTYKQHTYTHPLRSLVFPWLTFWAFFLFICYLCVSPRTAWPWISEPVPVTPTSAWYCLRLCPASDILFLPADLACLILPIKYCCKWIHSPLTIPYTMIN